MNQAFTNPAPVTVIGHFDGMENGLAVGWAFDPTRPGLRLQVEVMCGNEVVASGVADQFRDDLRPAGIGDGKHLFRLPVSYEILDGKTYELTAREASTGLALNGDPVLFAATGKKSDLALIARKQGLAILARILARPASQKPAAQRYPHYR